MPLDWRSPGNGKSIRLFARTAEKHNTPVTPSSSAKKDDDPPPQYLCYLQGGPGMDCPPPQNNSWTKFFVDKGYQVLTLDQRGTGLSTPVSSASLAAVGDVKAQANYLKCFRADSIVWDAEAIRLALTTKSPKPDAPIKSDSTSSASENGRPWSVMGQSFGGFCITTYLSMFGKDSLTECFTFGGTPPIHSSDPDDVYRRLAKRVLLRNDAYYRKYPEDVSRIKRILRALQDPKRSQLPDGGKLTPERFMAMGLNIGFHTGLDRIHEVVLHMATELDAGTPFSWASLDTAARQTPYDTHPLYALLHEPIYCQGQRPNFSAKRVLSEIPEFDLSSKMASEDDENPKTAARFVGEMVMPSVYDDFAHLQQMKEVGYKLAQDNDWPVLYDLEKLRKNEVPIYAAIYMHDMYVDYDLAQKAAADIGSLKPYITNMSYHDGVRSRPNDILEGVWSLRSDTID